MKNLITLIVLFILSTALLEAQFMVGGGISFNKSGGNTSGPGYNNDMTSRTNFSLTPKAGYFLSDKVLVGLEISLGFSSEKNPATDPVTVDKSSSFAVSPFLRYYAVRFDKFALFGQANVGISTSKSKEERGPTTTTGPTTNTFGIGALPGISYDISDKIELEGFLNFFSLNLSQSVKTTTTGNSEIKAKTNNFGFSTNTDNVVNTGSFTIGAIYKF